MKNFHFNHYERAFGNWLNDNGVQYLAVDEQKRAAFGRAKIKSFDYVLYPPRQEIIIAEVKGRKFTGKSLTRLSGFQSWVSVDDIDGLTGWQKVFGPGHVAAFVFAYLIENVDVDLDGRDCYLFDSCKYLFFCIKLDDYVRRMKLRSPRWRTVFLPAEDFRTSALQMQNILF